MITEVTDDEIRALMDTPGIDASTVSDCEHALRKRDRYWARRERKMQQWARARVAAAIAARKESRDDHA